MSKFFLGLGITMLIAAATSARAKTEEPAFTIMDRVGAIEIRQYSARLAAEVLIPGDEERARSEGFRLLADYIFGNNTANSSIPMTAPVSQQAAKSEKIAMTAPVAQGRDSSGNWRIRFFMPSKYTRETLPQPNNQAVQIVEVPGETMAVLRFSNSRSAKAVAAKTDDLLSGLEQSKWAPSGAPVAWFYDPPWTLPFFRRNEVAVTVQLR